MFKLTALVLLGLMLHFGELNGYPAAGTKSAHNSHQAVSSPTYSRLNTVLVSPVHHQKQEVYQSEYQPKVEQVYYEPKPQVAHSVYQSEDEQVVYKPRKQTYQTVVEDAPLVNYQREEVRTEYKPRTQVVQTVYQPKVEQVYYEPKPQVVQTVYQPEAEQVVYKPRKQTYQTVVEDAPLVQRQEEVRVEYKPRPQVVRTVYQPKVEQATYEPKNVYETSVVEQAPLTLTEYKPRPQVVQTVYEAPENDAPQEYNTEYRTVETPKQVKMVEVVERRQLVSAPKSQVVYTQRATPVLRNFDTSSRGYTVQSRLSSPITISSSAAHFGNSHSTTSQDADAGFGQGSYENQSGVSGGSTKGSYHFNIESTTGTRERSSVKVNHAIPSYGTTSHRSGTKY